MRNIRLENRIHYLDVLRLIAMAAVVVIHVTAPAWHSVPAENAEWRALNLYDSLVRFAVPLFVAISGALFQPERPIDLRRLYCKRILRLAVAWLFWSLLYASRFLLTGAPEGRTTAFLNGLFQGHYHLWFLPMMIGLNMITPLLAPILADKKKTRYLLLLSFVMAVLIPSLSLIPALSGVKTFTDKFDLYLPLGYVFYYVLGSALHRESLSKPVTALVYALGVVGLLLTLLGTAALSEGMTHYEPLYGNFAIGVAFETAAVFLLVKNLCGRKEAVAEGRLRFFAVAAELSFGVYLVHELFIILLPHIGVSVLSIHPLLSVPLISLAVLAASYFASCCLHRIPVLKDWIV